MRFPGAEPRPDCLAVTVEMLGQAKIPTFLHRGVK